MRTWTIFCLFKDIGMVPNCKRTLSETNVPVVLVVGVFEVKG